MPGIVNLPSARVTAAYSVPEGPCTAITRAPSSGAPEESVTTPATAAVVTPCAVAGARDNTTTAARTPTDHTKRVIRMGLRRAEKGVPGRDKNACRQERRQFSPTSHSSHAGPRVTGAATPGTRARRRE